MYIYSPHFVYLFICRWTVAFFFHLSSVNNNYYEYWYTSICLDSYLGLELLDHVEIVCLTIWQTAKLIGFYDDEMREGVLSTNKIHTLLSIFLISGFSSLLFCFLDVIFASGRSAYTTPYSVLCIHPLFRTKPSYNPSCLINW